MNEEVWHKIFKDWIESYKAIDTLYRNDVITDLSEADKLKYNLLEEIIETVKSEVEA